MQPIEDPKSNPAAGVVPAASPASPWRILRVAPLPRFRLEVVFEDGTRGEVGLQPFLDSGQVVGTVFEPLRDPAFFARAGLEMGVVTWPNGADLAPDAMYDAIAKNGFWTVEP